MRRNKLAILGNTLEIVGGSTVTTMNSHERRWRGFYAEETTLPPSELPAVEPLYAAIGMVMSPDPVRWTWKEDGRERVALFRQGNISTIPGSGMPEQRWSEPITFFTVTFEQEFLNVAAGPEIKREVDMKLCPHGQDDTVAHLLWALHNDVKAGLPGGRIVREAVGSALAAAVVEKFSTNRFNVHALPKGLDKRNLKQVLEYMREHLYDDLGVTELAKVALTSPYHFCRQFKASTGQSVHQYVLEQRIERAKYLLLHSDLSVAEIAFRSGLPNQSHFATVF